MYKINLVYYLLLNKDEQSQKCINSNRRGKTRTTFPICRVVIFMRASTYLYESVVRPKRGRKRVLKSNI